MANPRQRRKSRSSTHKPVSHARHAKKMLKKPPPIRGPKLLQDAWDSRKTVVQNYAALGLVHSLNPLASGGAEYDHTTAPVSLDIASANSEAHTAGPSNPQEPSTTSTPIPKGYGKIVRDTDGTVLRVELAEDDQRSEGPSSQAQNHTQKSSNIDAGGDEEMKDPEIDGQVRANWVTDLGGGSKGTDSDIVRSLERLSASGTCSSGPRHSSTLETLYLRRLMQKHGDDVAAMARDRRRNPEQRTVGQLSRAIKKAGRALKS